LALSAGQVRGQTPSGTGFVIAPNTLVTNHHVLEGCDDPQVVTSRGPRPARVLDSDANTDLALIWVSGLGGSAAKLRPPASVELGEQAFVFGFPYQGALSSSGNFTNGIVSALSGLRDTRHHLQITAPVQPGNSGGPLLDEAGNVIGVVVAKLDALRMAVATGDIPQNVNFAVSVDALHRFLAKASVPVTTQRLTAKRPTTNIAALARTFTLPIQCGLSVAGGASPPSERRREAERQREMERQREAERQRDIEAERQREQERLRELELERQREMERQREAERQRDIEAERQREQERLRELELERQRELERRMAARQEAPEKAPEKAADRPPEPREGVPPPTTPNPSGRGTAAADAAPSRAYGGLLVAAIQPKIVYADSSETNFETEVFVTARPDGRITSIRITRPSGSRVWDDAVVRALEKTERLPPDINGQVPPQITREGLLVILRPRDLPR
jgi:TonB family protein